MTRLLRLFTLLMPAGATMVAQTDPHWGIQGHYFQGALPGVVVDQIHSLPEKPRIETTSWNAGVVRFHANGSPNWALEFTKMQLSLSGALTVNGATTRVEGSGILRGVQYARYLNFFSTKYISGGLGTGIGAVKTEASYTRFTQAPNGAVVTGGGTFDRWLPTFQTLAQVDVRPVRWISLSPYYGLRNGTLGFGGAIRLHFTR
jgi:hypothetical protein